MNCLESAGEDLQPLLRDRDGAGLLRTQRHLGRHSNRRPLATQTGTLITGKTSTLWRLKQAMPPPSATNLLLPPLLRDSCVRPSSSSSLKSRFTLTDRLSNLALAEQFDVSSCDSSTLALFVVRTFNRSSASACSSLSLTLSTAASPSAQGLNSRFALTDRFFQPSVRCKDPCVADQEPSAG